MNASSQPTLPGISLAAHPRATIQVRRIKGAGGLLCFALVALATWRAGHRAELVFADALAGGIAGYLVTWGAALTAWRALMVAEMREARAAALLRAEQRQAELEAEAEEEAKRLTEMARAAAEEDPPPVEDAGDRRPNRWRAR